MSIGHNIKQRREAKRWNQTELAEKAGIKQATISRLESGVNDNITIDNLRRIAAALGCTVVDLLPESDKKKPPRDKPL